MNTDESVRKKIWDSLKEFIIEMQGDNDRSVVIVGASNVDFLLRRLLEQSLLPPRRKKEKEDELFDSSLSSFSLKIDLCYRLGLIDMELCQILHSLRKIRNHFAHKIKGCDLNSPPHSDRIQDISIYLKDSMLLNELRNFFPPLDRLSFSGDFRIMLSLISVILEMKLQCLPKTMKANPASLSWIPNSINL